MLKRHSVSVTRDPNFPLLTGGGEDVTSYKEREFCWELDGG